MAAFSGAKLALICAGELIAYKRDDKPDIPWPGLWDLPGGGREGDEDPVACALRELEEEFALVLPPERIHWQRAYPGLTPGTPEAWFMVGFVTAEEIAAIRFGEEGQYWQMMALEAFLAHPEAAPHLQQRLRDYLELHASPDR